MDDGIPKRDFIELSQRQMRSFFGGKRLYAAEKAGKTEAVGGGGDFFCFKYGFVDEIAFQIVPERDCRKPAGKRCCLPERLGMLWYSLSS